MIIWFCCQIGSFSLCCDKFNLSMLSHILQKIFSRPELLKLNQIFLKLFLFFLRCVFISIYGFSQAFWLNLITLWMFFKANSWFNTDFKFRMCIPYSVLSCELATSFWTFSFFILSAKTSKSLWNSSSFSRYWTSTFPLKIILHHFLHYSIFFIIISSFK